MKSNKILSRVLMLAFAAVLLNQVACSKARFGSVENHELSVKPVPDNATAGGDIPESGDVVRGDVCDPFCDTDNDPNHEDRTGTAIDNGFGGTNPGESSQDNGFGVATNPNTSSQDNGFTASPDNNSPDGTSVDNGFDRTNPQTETPTVGVDVNSPDTTKVNPNSSFVVGSPVTPTVTDTATVFPDLTFTPPAVVIEKESQKCFWNTYKDTRKTRDQKINGVSLWLVVDSSRSFDEERLAVAKAIASGFVTSLTRQVPVTISVVAAHAPSSAYKGNVSAAPSVNNEIFYRQSNEPLQITIRPDMSKQQVTAIQNELFKKLGANMKESPLSIAKADGASLDGFSWKNKNGIPIVGPHSGSDELGILNFMEAMKVAKLPEDHAWVVLFLSDENDVCVPFETTVNGVNRYAYSHITEKEIHENFCEGVSVDKAYNQALQFAGDRSFVLGSWVYTNQGKIPYGVQHSVGRGYLELVRKRGHQGAVIDLASRNSFELETIASRLVKALAQMTNESDIYHTSLPITTDPDWNKRTDIEKDIGSIYFGGQKRYDLQVYVNGKKSNYTVDGDNSLVQLTEYGQEVKIRFCEKP